MIKQTCSCQVFIVLFLVVCCLASLPAQEIRSAGGGGVWSSTASWLRVSGTGLLPVVGDHVVITAGSPITVDTQPPSMSRLEIHDALVVSDTFDCLLTCSRVDVGGVVSYMPGVRQPGTLQVGSVAAPFQHNFTIHLTDNLPWSSWAGANFEALESLSMIVHGGSVLDMHGRPAFGGVTRVNWLKLKSGSNALPGSSSIELEAAPGWASGDRVVLASTDFDMNQAEVVQVGSVTGLGVVSLAGALAHYHHGGVERGLVDERAEVGLLTHNVKITSDRIVVSGLAGREDVRGGSVTFHNRDGADAPPTVRVDYVEFEGLGWKGAHGRYPIHIHKVGVVVGDFWIKNCSIHRSCNRGVAIHASSGILVSQNVIYDVCGHAVYLEDRSETGNVISKNLALVTRLPTLPVDPTVEALGMPWTVTPGAEFFCAHDQEVSTFWISNVDNSLVGNVAAGSDRHGFWYDISIRENVQGSSGWYYDHCHPSALAPFFHGTVHFASNTAHSNGVHGFWNDLVRGIPYDMSLTNPLSAEVVFEDFTAYKNRHAGVWNRSYGTQRWVGARLADNRTGFYVASEAFVADRLTEESTTYFADELALLGIPNIPFDNLRVGVPCMSYASLENSVVIGRSANQPLSEAVPGNPWMEVQGVVVYDGVMHLDHVDFYDFVSLPVAPASAPAEFAGLSYRVAAAITAHASPATPQYIFYPVDPRNIVNHCTFTGCETNYPGLGVVSNAVLFPNPTAPSGLPDVPGVGMIDAPYAAGGLVHVPHGFYHGTDATMIMDIDGCIPGSSAGSYVMHDTPLLRPVGSSPVVQLPLGWGGAAPGFYGGYSLPRIIGGPGVTGQDNGVAQLQMIVPAVPGLSQIPAGPGNNSSGVYGVNFQAVGRPQQQVLYDKGISAMYNVLPHPGVGYEDGDRLFGTNVLLSKPGQAEEVYALDFLSLNGPPGAYSIRLRFGPPGRSIVLKIPCVAHPNNVTIDCPTARSLYPWLGLPWAVSEVFTQTDFDSGLGDVFFDDPADYLWLRMVMPDLGFIGIGVAPLHPVFAGREVVIRVD
jgi:hypothetical protein